MAGTSAALSAAAAPLLSRSALLACLLPGLALHTPSLPAGLQHVRTKVYTSNVMDEERTKRITDHMDYMRARKAYRNGLYKLVLGWRHDMRQQALKDQAQLRQERGAAAREEAQDLAQRLREKQLDGLGEQLKQVELEHQVAQVRLQRAERQQAKLARMERARGTRYQRLLEASRHWIREEEFEAAVNKALDNPEPFGFITNVHVKATGY